MEEQAEDREEQEEWPGMWVWIGREERLHIPWTSGNVVAIATSGVGDTLAGFTSMESEEVFYFHVRERQTDSFESEKRLHTC